MLKDLKIDHMHPDAPYNPRTGSRDVAPNPGFPTTSGNYKTPDHRPNRPLISAVCVKEKTEKEGTRAERKSYFVGYQKTNAVEETWTRLNLVDETRDCSADVLADLGHKTLENALFLCRLFLHSSLFLSRG